MKDLSSLDDTALIGLINADGPDRDTALETLTDRHSGLYESVVGGFSFSNISGVSKEEILQQKHSVVYELAKKWNPEKKTKFSTFLYANIRWSLLNLYNKAESSDIPKSPFDPMMVEIVGEKEAHSTDEQQAVLEFAAKFVESDGDERVKEIFRLRYGGEEIMTWHEIGDKLGMTYEWARTLHNKFIEKMRAALEKEEIAFIVEHT